MSNQKGIYARCIYAVVVSDVVNIECKVKNKIHELDYHVSNNNKTLPHTNSNGESSIYNKM